MTLFMDNYFGGNYEQHSSRLNGRFDTFVQVWFVFGACFMSSSFAKITQNQTKTKERRKKQKQFVVIQIKVNLFLWL